MKFRVIEKSYGPVSITVPTTSEWIDVAANGGDSVCYVMTASAASSPNTANITLQGSLDKTNAIAVGSAVNVTVNGSLSLSSVDPVFRYYRVSYAIATGSYTSTLKVLVKGDLG